MSLSITIFTIWQVACMGAFLACAWIDHRTFRIPNRITYPFLFMTLFMTFVNGHWPTALWGGLLAGGVLLVPRLLAGPEKAGMGDVKLAMLGGLLLGPEQTIYALLIAFVGALIFKLPALILGRLKAQQAIPFGPYLALGFIVVLLVGIINQFSPTTFLSFVP